jgi:hypothetical protein
MLRADAAISRIRRDLTFSTLLKSALTGAALAAVAFHGFGGRGLHGMVILLLVLAAWIALSYRSIRGSRLAADSPSLIAAGHFEAAEQHIEQALRSFSLFRTAKLLTLHHLAVLRHAQRQWQDSAALSRALLGQRLGPLQNLSRSSLLLLADALLELGDLNGAYEAIAQVYRQKLALGEAMNLLSVQCDYLARIGGWKQMLEQPETKVQLAELMPTANAAKTQALLALAAKNEGREDWSTWLRRRVELLVDVRELVEVRPILKTLWPDQA